MPDAARTLDTLPRLRSLAEVAGLVDVVRPLYVRFSGGPEQDAESVSRDHDSGCLLPGLSVNPLTPEPWWDRPVEHWVARQLCQYAHLMTPERSRGSSRARSRGAARTASRSWWTSSRPRRSTRGSSRRRAGCTGRRSTRATTAREEPRRQASPGRVRTRAAGISRGRVAAYHPATRSTMSATSTTSPA